MKPNEFVKKVVKNYKGGKGIFQNKINAEELIPSDIDDIHKALYIFYVLQLDYAMKSQILYTGAIKLYKLKKDFFDPNFVLTTSDSVLGQYLRDYLHPRYINEALKRYYFNSKVLYEKYDNDPRNIFSHSHSCNEILTKLKEFRGFGPKIGAFFIRTMINVFNYSYPDIDTMLPPVDIHDVRIAYLLGYTTSDKMTLKNIDFVKRLWNEACISADESWLIFDKALWLLGSEGKPKSKEDVVNLLL